MTKIEKKMILALAACLLLLFGGLYSIAKDIDKAGGVKGILISVGKEINDIKKQIDSK